MRITHFSGTSRDSWDNPVFTVRVPTPKNNLGHLGQGRIYVFDPHPETGDTPNPVFIGMSQLSQVSQAKRQHGRRNMSDFLERWADWKPEARILTESAGNEPTKTSEMDSVVFAGVTLAEIQKIEAEPGQAEVPLEDALKGKAIELAAAGGVVFLVSDEDAARRLGEPRGVVFTAEEIRVMNTLPGRKPRLR